METIYLSQLTNQIAKIKNDCIVTSVETDSRSVKKDSVFLAIKGERVNGEHYAKQAVENGACFVLTENKIKDIPCDMQVIVPNILDASIALGANFRDIFDIDIVAVTGSVGKTGTKDFIYAALSGFAKTVCSQGNHNNEIGMPNTIYTFTKQDKYAVLEMGMANINDIHKLSVAAKPKYAVVSCIGVSHLESLKTQENILKAKLEICDGMPKDGILVLNGDDKFLSKADIKNPNNVLYFAIENENADVVAKNIKQEGFFTHFTITDKKNNAIQCSIPAVGLHNVMNALSAYTVVTAMGFDPQKTAQNLAGYTVSGMRQKILQKDDITFIEDCYNANPDSMKAAINTICSIKQTRAIAVLGDMFELGENSEQMHTQIGQYAKQKGVDILLCTGEKSKYICKGFGDEAVYFDTKDSLAHHLKNIVKAKDTVVFKASRGMAFEEIIKKIY